MDSRQSSRNKCKNYSLKTYSQHGNLFEILLKTSYCISLSSWKTQTEIPNGSQTHDPLDLRVLFRYFHFIQVANPIIIHSIHIHHFDMLSLSVWQDTCLTYKNLVYDLTHHVFPIVQWLERPSGIWKVMGSTPVGGPGNSFSECFDFRVLLRYFHFI